MMIDQLRLDQPRGKQVKEDITALIRVIPHH